MDDLPSSDVYAAAPRCPYCNGKIQFRPCPCLKGSVEIGGLDMADAMRMLAEMTILFEIREPWNPPTDDWPKGVEHWQPFGNSTLSVPWHRRMTADSGALVLPFVGWGKAPPAWYAVLYKGGKIIETETVPRLHDNRSPAEAMFWADTRLGRPTAWERLR